jgi:hypothetical protein
VIATGPDVNSTGGSAYLWDGQGALSDLTLQGGLRVQVPSTAIPGAQFQIDRAWVAWRNFAGGDKLLTLRQLDTGEQHLIELPAALRGASVELGDGALAAVGAGARLAFCTTGDAGAALVYDSATRSVTVLSVAPQRGCNSARTDGQRVAWFAAPQGLTSSGAELYVADAVQPTTARRLSPAAQSSWLNGGLLAWSETAGSLYRITVDQSGSVVFQADNVSEIWGLNNGRLAYQTNFTKLQLWSAVTGSSVVFETSLRAQLTRDWLYFGLYDNDRQVIYRTSAAATP